MKNKKIDIVVAWVDGDDPVWREERNKYVSKKDLVNPSVGGDKRFKDTGLFKYWFRGIEKYAPWVNHVYLVTCGHYPEWLNIHHSKLTLIKHDQIIDAKYLPTFNSNLICLSIGKIPGLSENFIFFNDDMFLINKTKDIDFFKNDLPRDMAVQGIMSPSNNDMFWKIRSSLINSINAQYKKKDCIRKHRSKWFSYAYPLKYNIRNLFLKKFDYFTDIYNPHVPHSYKKESFSKVWDIYSGQCLYTAKNRFRDKNDITEWLVRYYQLVNGIFYPTNLDKLGLVVDANDEGSENLILDKKMKYLCINNNASGVKLEKIVKAFEIKLGEKSSFEK